MKIPLSICALITCWTCAVYAQATTSNAVIGPGYVLPAPVRAAPGQLITTFVQGRQRQRNPSAAGPSIRHS